MPRFYNVTVDKRSIGTAIEHREPPLQGKVLAKVSESQTDGDHRLIVLDCSDDQDRLNLAQAGVTALSETDAVALAARYQPAWSGKRLNPTTRQMEQVSLPALDLRMYYAAPK